MKTPSGIRRRIDAFTLIELLVVAAIVGILVALLLPTLANAKKRSRQVHCLSQVKQIGLAFHAFAHDHGNRFPTQVSTNAGGTREYVRPPSVLGAEAAWAFAHFRVLSNELVTPQVLICPTDLRRAATNFPGLRTDNVSYFAGVLADYDQPDSVLAGDRNVVPAPGGAAGWTVTQEVIAWTAQLHEFRGNLLFADGRAEQTRGGAFQVASARPGGSGGSSGGGGGGGGGGSPGSPPPVVPPAFVPGGSPPAQPPGSTGPSAPAGGTTRPGAATASTPSGPGGGGGAMPGTASAATAGGGTAGVFERLENSLPERFTTRTATVIPVSDGAVPVIGAAAPVLLASTNAVLPSNTVAMVVSNPPPPEPAEETESAESPVPFARKVVNTGTRGTYLLLLLLLAALVAVEIYRRRKRRSPAHSDEGAAGAP